MYKLTFYVPEPHLEQVKEAVFAAGGGRYEKYDKCCWQVAGQGQFRPLDGSNPFLGQLGKVEIVPEYRVEMICKASDKAVITAALLQSHPYETPAYDFVHIEI